ncbi:MAG TPA: hypothetical protein VEJ67_03545 [Candidatus Cybelea sp.]|nr:hypothetical protein [Candidatus Cybelea sp.]
MTDKSGVDFDRQVFVQTEEPPKAPEGVRMGGLLFAAAIIAAMAFVGYKLLPQTANYSSSNDSATLTDLDRRLASIESRLDKLERSRRAAVPAQPEKPSDAQPEQPTEAKVPPAKAAARAAYEISPSPRRETHVPVSAPPPDPDATERLSDLQLGLSDLKKSEADNKEAWQAATDRLADMAGQVGTQGVEILRSQDELNEVLSRTEMEAIPFELLRGSNPQPVGPVSMVLKSANAKTQRYTLCVYIQPSCIELKDRTLMEVVQFVSSRNAAPLEVIATRIVKDEILGYLEVPRNQRGH